MTRRLANLAFFVVEYALLIQLPLLAAADAPATSTNILIVTTGIGFLTMVVQQLFIAYAARRKHADDVEDKKLLREQITADTEKVKAEITLRVAELSALSRRNFTAIQDGNLAADHAYHEANNLNQKIADLHQVNLDVRTDEIKTMVETATVAAQQAYREANQANNKIRALQQANAALLLQREDQSHPAEDSEHSG